MQKTILFISLCLFLFPLFTGCDAGRTTWSGTKISDKFCAADENGDCQFIDYANWASKQAAAGILLAVLSLIAFPVFCAGRFCCNQFGGRGRSKGICCVKKDKFRPYSWRSIVAVKIIIIVLMLGILASAIVGFAGDKSKAKGITSMTTILLDTVHELVDRASAIADALIDLPYTKDEGQKVQDVVDSIQGFVKQGDDIKVTINKYNKIVSAAMIVAFSLPLALVVIGAIGAVFNLRWFAIIAGLFCFLCSIFIWLSFGVHQTVYAVVDDVCVEFDGYLSHSGENSTISKYLDFADCSKFQDFSDLAKDATGKAITAACDAIITICNDSYVSCASDAKSNTTCNKTTVSRFESDTNITDYLIGCGPNYDCPYDPNLCPNVGDAIVGLCFNQSRTVLECSTACNNTALRNLTDTAVTNIDLLLRYTDLVDNQILPLLNCTFITSALEKLNGAICISFVGGIHKISIASGFLGALLIPSTIILIMGFKRFRRDQTSAEMADLALDDHKTDKEPNSEEMGDPTKSPTQNRLLK